MPIVWARRGLFGLQYTRLSVESRQPSLFGRTGGQTGVSMLPWHTMILGMPVHGDISGR